MPKLYKEIIKIAVLGGLLVVVQAFAFTEPSVAPPGDNVPAPLNVGGNAQTKLGGLILNTGGAVNGLAVASGNVGIGTLTPDSGVELYVKGEDAIGNADLVLESASGLQKKWDLASRGDGGIFEIHDLTDGPTPFRIEPGAPESAFYIHNNGKVDVPGGIDPPYISFSGETHASIRQFAKSVKNTEKVMEFWNQVAHRMEIYVVAEDKFYTLNGDSAGN